MGETKKTQIQILKVIGWFFYVDFFLLFPNIRFFLKHLQKKVLFIVRIRSRVSRMKPNFLSSLLGLSSVLSSILKICEGAL